MSSVKPAVVEALGNDQLRQPLHAIVTRLLGVVPGQDCINARIWGWYQTVPASLRGRAPCMPH